MKKIIVAAVVTVLAAGAGFAVVLYKAGENMHMYRCGCQQGRR